MRATMRKYARSHNARMRACVLRARMREYVRAHMRAYVREYMRAYARMCVRVWLTHLQARSAGGQASKNRSEAGGRGSGGC